MALRNLFEIATEYLDAIDELDTFMEENPDTDEMPEHIYERLHINRNEMEEKLSAYKDVISILEVDMELLKKRIAEYKAKMERKERTIQRLKSVMAFAIKQYGDQNDKGNFKFKTRFGSFNYIKTTKVLVDEAQCPSAYKAFDFSLNKMTAGELAEFKAFYEEFVRKHGAKWYNKAIFDLRGVPIKDMIADKLKAGEEVPGCKLDPEAGYVRIY